MVDVRTIPANPKEVHAGTIRQVWMINYGMENAYDSGIPIRVRFWSIRAEDHDVGVCGEFDVVLFTAQIISGVVHPKHFVLIELASTELDLSSLCI